MYNPTPRNTTTKVAEGGSESFLGDPVENEKSSHTALLSERMVCRATPRPAKTLLSGWLSERMENPKPP